MKSRESYRKIEIPEELVDRVSQALRTPPEPPRSLWRAPIYATGACAICFALLVNVSPAFAAAVEVIPGIGAVARLITVREEVEESGRDHVKIRLPALANTGNTALEQRVNEQIREKMERAVAEARARVAEYRKAQLATGGSVDDVIPVMIDIDYELKYTSPVFISFVVSKMQTLANAYTEQMFYNLALPEGRPVTLAERLGDDYKSRVNAEIRRQIAERKRTNENAMFFEEGEAGGFRSIADDQAFFLNQRGEVVIVFNKYEIAPGAMGILHFVIPTPALASAKTR